MTFLLKNDYNTHKLNANNSVVNAGILKKPIDTVQKTIETSIDTLIANPNEDEKKKKLRRRAIATGSAVLVLGALTLLLNPRSSGKISQKLKAWQNKFDLKTQQSKDSFLKSKFYSGCKKIFGVAEKGSNIYFNLNSGKDVLFQSFCTNSNKKYPEFLTKNKTIHKIVKAVDNFFVKILAKPHKQVTKWFDSISQYTVKNNYKNASKNLDALENFIKLQKDKLPREKQSLLEAKLKEIAEARKAFSNESLAKRFSEQEKVMQNLENDLWNSIYTKEKGLMKKPTKFWVQEALKKQKEKLHEK